MGVPWEGEETETFFKRRGGGDGEEGVRKAFQQRRIRQISLAVGNPLKGQDSGWVDRIADSYNNRGVQQPGQRHGH